MNTNALIEKFIANPNTLSDIKNRIIEIDKVFGIMTYRPLVDSLTTEIEAYVLEDMTNRIKSKKKWLERTDNLVNYTEIIIDSLVQQIDNKPINFMVNREVEVDGTSATIKWDNSVDPKGLEVIYSIYYSNKGNFKGDLNGVISDLKSNYGKIDNLSPGQYYFYVEASNGTYKTFGHDIRNSFVIK